MSGTDILKKLTARNFLAVATGTAFLGIVAKVVTTPEVITENPVVTFLLGSFSTAVILVYQFYFRRAEPTT